MQTTHDPKTGEEAVQGADLPPLTPERLLSYLERRFGQPVRIEDIRPLTGGKTSGAEALKKFGYGRPLLVKCRTGEAAYRLVFHRICQNAFGREREDDRMAAVWLDFRTFNRLPRHVPAEDMVVRNSDGELSSAGDAREMLLVTAYRPGTPYAEDLLRLRDDPAFQPSDLRRAELLSSYLARIHATKKMDPPLWRRRLRDLVGHGEGIMGLTDSYEPVPAGAGDILNAIEDDALRWRRRLKPMSGRLSQVHGDFHPFNIVFQSDDRFWVLDRSRGEWGEPADDVSCLAINYLFFSLQRFGRLEGVFRELHDAFWHNYLARSGDRAIAEVIPPWFAWRALVLASPVWYPDIEPDVRHKILLFARTVISLGAYDHSLVNRYIEGA